MKLLVSIHHVLLEGHKIIDRDHLLNKIFVLRPRIGHFARFGKLFLGDAKLLHHFCEQLFKQLFKVLRHKTHVYLVYLRVFKLVFVVCIKNQAVVLHE